MAHPYAYASARIGSAQSMSLSPSTSQTVLPATSVLKDQQVAAQQLPSNSTSSGNSASAAAPVALPGPSRRQRRWNRNTTTPKPPHNARKRSGEGIRDASLEQEAHAASSSGTYTPPRLYHFKPYSNAPPATGLFDAGGKPPAGAGYTYAGGRARHHSRPASEDALVPAPTAPASASSSETLPQPDSTGSRPKSLLIAGKRVVKEVFGGGGNNAGHVDGGVAHYGRGGAGGVRVRKEMTSGQSRDAPPAFPSSVAVSRPQESHPSDPTLSRGITRSSVSTTSSGSGPPHDDASSSQYASSSRSAKTYASTAPIYPLHLYGSDPGESRRGSTASFVGQFAGLEFDSGSQLREDLEPATHGDKSSVGTFVGSGSSAGVVHPGVRPPTDLAQVGSVSQAPYRQMRSSSYPSTSTSGTESSPNIGGSLQPYASHPPLGSPFNPSYALEAPTYQDVSSDTPPGLELAPLQENQMVLASASSQAVELHQSVVRSSMAVPQLYRPLLHDSPRTMRDQIMHGPVRRSDNYFQPTASAYQDDRPRTAGAIAQMSSIADSMHTTWPPPQAQLNAVVQPIGEPGDNQHAQNFDPTRSYLLPPASEGMPSSTGSSSSGTPYYTPSTPSYNHIPFTANYTTSDPVMTGKEEYHNAWVEREILALRIAELHTLKPELEVLSNDAGESRNE